MISAVIPLYSKALACVTSLTLFDAGRFAKCLLFASLEGKPGMGVQHETSPM